LYELNFVSSESSHVRDVEDAIVGFSVLSVDSSDLDVIFVGDRLVKILSFHKFWKVDVNGSSETCSKIGWAVRDITKMFIISEFSFLFNFTSGDGKSLEDFEDVGALLHGDNSELIFFIDPDEESFVIIVINSSSLWPVSLKTT
jgi:hypothetical protein